jgi:energy-converting hydrogenase Eha subunit F
MNLKNVENCERTKLERFLNKVQLPHIYKKIGVFIVLLSFIIMIVFKSIDDEALWIRPFLKHVMLIGLLITSLSREKIEDELIEVLRSKSYALAFIIGVLYTMLQPIANYIVDFIQGKQEGPIEIGYVQVLLFMLLIQVGFFELLKRNR